MPKVASETSAFPTAPARGNNSNRPNAGDSAQPFAAALDEAAQNAGANAERPTDQAPRSKESKAVTRSEKVERTNRTDKSDDAKRPRNAERADKPASKDDGKDAAKAENADQTDTASDSQTEADADVTADSAVSVAPVATAAQTVEIDAVTAMAAAIAPVQIDVVKDAEPTTAQTTAVDAVSVASNTNASGVASEVDASIDAPKAAAPQGEAAKPVEDAMAKQPVVAAAAQPLIETATPKTSVPQVPRANAAGAHKVGAKLQALEHAAAHPEMTNDQPTSPAQGTDDAKPAPRLSELVAMAREGARGDRFEPVRTTDAAAPLPQAGAPAAQPGPIQVATPVAASMAQTPAAQAQNALPATPLNGVGVEIAAQALNGKHRFEIRLDPPELGRIEVRLDVDSKGQVVSHISADRGDTLDLLRRDGAQLERALQDAGLKTSDQGLQFSLRDQGGRQHEAPARDSVAVTVSDDLTAQLEMTRGYRRNAGIAGGIDIRV